MPNIPQWRLSALPRYIGTPDVGRLIGTCDRAKPTGARDVDQQRALGFKFRVHEILRRGYVAFAEELGDRHIRYKLPASRSSRTRNGRASARNRQPSTRSPRHQLPPDEKIPHKDLLSLTA